MMQRDKSSLAGAVSFPVRRETPMRINIIARHTEISPEFRERISSDVERFARIIERINTVDVTVTDSAGGPRADIVFRVNQNDFKATGMGSNLQQAFDIAVEKAERQLRKYKGKLIGRRNEPAPSKEPGSVV